MRRSARLLLIVALLLGMLVAFVALRKPDDREVGARQQSAEYVADQECAQCHVQIAANYARSGMSRSWQAVDASAMNLSSQTAISDSRQEYRYEVLIDNAQVSQQETRTDEPGHRLVKAARYAIGSGKHARALAC